MDRFFRVSWAVNDTAVIPDTFQDFSTEEDARRFISSLSGVYLVTLERVSDWIKTRTYTRLEI